MLSITGNASELVRSYLQRIGQLNSPVLGEVRREPTESDTDYFRSQVERQRVSSAFIIYVAVAILCIIFAVGIFLVFFYRESPRALAAIFGGNFFSLLVVVAWLRRLWLDQSTLGALLILVSVLPPKEGAAVLTSWYFKTVKQVTR